MNVPCRAAITTAMPHHIVPAEAIHTAIKLIAQIIVTDNNSIRVRSWCVAPEHLQLV